MPPALCRSALDLLVHYARHHRDRRNITMHGVGIPLAVFGLAVLLGRPVSASGLSPAWVLWGLLGAWYLSRGLWRVGAVATALTGALVALATPVAAGGTLLWLLVGMSALTVGCALQLAGHYYEGRGPACVDNGVALLVGPQFIAAEWLFSQGWLDGLRREIERRAGPTHLRDLTVPVA